MYRSDGIGSSQALKVYSCVKVETMWRVFAFGLYHAGPRSLVAQGKIDFVLKKHRKCVQK